MHTHFEIFVEDASGKIMLDVIMAKLLPADGFSYAIHSYKGSGKLPKNLTSATQIRTQTLLNNVPRLISGFLNTYDEMDNYKAVFVIVTDCDDKNCIDFKCNISKAIQDTVKRNIDNCIICLAIEEMEAWLLGDFNAIKQAYPSANKKEHDSYRQDSICGTWEKLYKVIDGEGFRKEKRPSYNTIGLAKSEWARKITPYLDFELNLSASFQYYIKKIRESIYC